MVVLKTLPTKEAVESLGNKVTYYNLLLLVLDAKPPLLIALSVRLTISIPADFEDYVRQTDRPTY